MELVNLNSESIHFYQQFVGDECVQEHNNQIRLEIHIRNSHSNFQVAFLFLIHRNKIIV